MNEYLVKRKMTIRELLYAFNVTVVSVNTLQFLRYNAYLHMRTALKYEGSRWQENAVYLEASCFTNVRALKKVLWLRGSNLIFIIPDYS